MAVVARRDRWGRTAREAGNDAERRVPEAAGSWRRERCPGAAGLVNCRTVRCLGGLRRALVLIAFSGRPGHEGQGMRGQALVVGRPGLRPPESGRGGFWAGRFRGPACRGGRPPGLCGVLLRRMMRLRLVLDGLLAGMPALGRDGVGCLKGGLAEHRLLGAAREKRPEMMGWRAMRSAEVSRAPLWGEDKLQAKIEAQLSAIKRMPQLIRSFFKAPSVAYITDR